MPRSERCRIRGNCAHGTPGHAWGQAPAAGGAPVAWASGPGGAAHRAGASPRTGLRPSGDGWRFVRAVKAVSEVLRTVARAWAWAQAVERQGRAGRPRPASAFFCFAGIAGRRWKPCGGPARDRRASGAAARAIIVGPLHADFVQAHNEASWRGLEISTGSGRLLRWSPATTDTRVLRLWSKPNRLLSRLGAQAV
jgi:hypothetical protein